MSMRNSSSSLDRFPNFHVATQNKLIALKSINYSTNLISVCKSRRNFAQKKNISFFLCLSFYKSLLFPRVLILYLQLFFFILSNYSTVGSRGGFSCSNRNNDTPSSYKIKMFSLLFFFLLFLLFLLVLVVVLLLFVSRKKNNVNEFSNGLLYTKQYKFFYNLFKKVLNFTWNYCQ